MGPIHLKLSMSDGLTRRISFPNWPSWTELATRFMLSVVFLGVSYVDLDGHEVTLSSQGELCDFYNSNVDNTIQANQPIRFRVVRRSDSVLYAIPTTSSSQCLLRNLPHRTRPGNLLPSYLWTITTSHSMTYSFHLP